MIMSAYTSISPVTVARRWPRRRSARRRPSCRLETARRWRRAPARVTPSGPARRYSRVESEKIEKWAWPARIRFAGPNRQAIGAASGPRRSSGLRVYPAPTLSRSGPARGVGSRSARRGVPGCGGGVGSRGGWAGPLCVFNLTRYDIINSIPSSHM